MFFGMDTTTEARLASFEPFAHFLIRKWGTEQGNVKAEDAAQEALIEAWHVLERDSTKSDTYIRTAMKYRVIEILGRNQSMTGSPPHQGKRDLHTSSLDAEIEVHGSEIPEMVDPRDEEAVTIIDVTQLVRDAVAAQREEDRAMIWLRFWEDLEWTAVADRMGTPCATVRTRWKSRVRPALQAALCG